MCKKIHSAPSQFQTNLKQQSTVTLQTDPFPIGKSEKLVVIHYRVHIFYPEGVHIPIKQNIPASYKCMSLLHTSRFLLKLYTCNVSFIFNFLPSLFFVSRFVDITEDVGKNPISPVTSIWIKHSIQFNDTQGFSVQRIELSIQPQSGKENKTTSLVCFFKT